MAVFIILVIILIAYGVLNIPLVNQMASPFLAPVLIYLVWFAYKQMKENEENKKSIYFLQNQLFEIRDILLNQKNENGSNNQDKNN